MSLPTECTAWFNINTSPFCPPLRPNPSAHLFPTFITTDSTDQSPSWEANSSSARQKKKIPALYGPRKFITAFATAHHLSLYRATSTHSMPSSHFLKIQFNIIIPSTPRFSKRPLSLRFPPPKPCIYLSSLPCVPHAPPISSFLICNTRMIFGEKYRSTVLANICYFLNPLAPELDIYSLAHHLCTTWIFYEPRRVTLGNTRHFVEE